MKKPLPLLFLIWFAIGCSFHSPWVKARYPAGDLNRHPTQTALGEERHQSGAPIQRATLALRQTASRRGKLSYPSEFIPPLSVAATNVATQAVFFVDTAENQTNDQVEVLSAGEYPLIADPKDGSFAGGYTQMVLCGLSADCSGHSLIPLLVQAGKVITAIDPTHWDAPPKAFPPNPIP